MVELELHTPVAAPRAAVFARCLDIDAHVASMSRSRERAIAGVTTGHIRLDEEVTWRAWHFGIPFRMTSRITELDTPLRFVDEQLGCTRTDAENGVSWYRGEEELILFPAREANSGPHRHGRVGWQHLAFAVDSRAEVDRLHTIALDAGWASVREPKPYPRYNDRYYASFVEDANGIRLEFMHNPPRDTSGG